MNRTQKIGLILFIFGMSVLVGFLLSNSTLFVTQNVVNGSSEKDIVIGSDTEILFSDYTLSVFEEGYGDVSIVLRNGRYSSDGGNLQVLYHDVSWKLVRWEGGKILYITSVKR